MKGIMEVTRTGSKKLTLHGGTRGFTLLILLLISDRQAGRQAGRQADRQTDRQAMAMGWFMGFRVQGKT